MNNKVRLPYVSDEFLDIFKTNFSSDYLYLYKNLEKDKIKEIFKKDVNLLESEYYFSYTPLELNNDEEATLKNIKILLDSFDGIDDRIMMDERVWVALINTYYLDYHLYIISGMKSVKNVDNGIKSRTVFTHGKKRSLFVNNLALLYFIGKYTVDNNDINNKYEYTKYFIKNAYRGNSISFFSSNLMNNKNLCLGALDAIIKMEQNEIYSENRYLYSNTAKFLNKINGVRIIDLLEKEEVSNLILDNYKFLDDGKMKRGRRFEINHE